MQLASFSLAEVTYATGDISYLVQEQAKSASFKVKAKQENVSGVVLPTFEVDRVPGSGAHPARPVPVSCCLDYDLLPPIASLLSVKTSTSRVSGVAASKFSVRRKFTRRRSKLWSSSRRCRRRS